MNFLFLTILIISNLTLCCQHVMRRELLGHFPSPRPGVTDSVTFIPEALKLLSTVHSWLLGHSTKVHTLYSASNHWTILIPKALVSRIYINAELQHLAIYITAILLYPVFQIFYFVISLCCVGHLHSQGRTSLATALLKNNIFIFAFIYKFPGPYSFFNFQYHKNIIVFV